MCRESRRGKLVLATGISLVVLGVMVVLVQAEAPALTFNSAQFEVDFMTDMIDHHTLAVELSAMCTQQASHPELAIACQAIVQEQNRDIRQMQTWLRAWYGIQYEPQLQRQDLTTMRQLASLGGVDFELAFMQTMIDHHRQAIERAQACRRRAFHGELVRLCQSTLETQTREIQHLQTWQSSWAQFQSGSVHEKSGGTNPPDTRGKLKP